MGKGILGGLCVSSFLFFYFSNISAISLQIKAPANKSISCEYIDPMEGPIPNPYNCSEFYVCRAADNTSYTIPDKMSCAEGFNNKSTYWNIYTCKCEHENTGCYDIDQHGSEELFGCATLFIPTPTEASGTPTTTQNSVE